MITGIGLAKSAQLWFRVMHQLSSGPDYRALGRALTSACVQMVGHGMSRAECAEVNEGADAVGMGSWTISRCGANRPPGPRKPT